MIINLESIGFLTCQVEHFLCNADITCARKSARSLISESFRLASRTAKPSIAHNVCIISIIFNLAIVLNTCEKEGGAGVV